MPIYIETFNQVNTLLEAVNHQGAIFCIVLGTKLLTLPKLLLTDNNFLTWPLTVWQHTHQQPLSKPIWRWTSTSSNFDREIIEESQSRGRLFPSFVSKTLKYMWFSRQMKWPISV